MIYLEYFNSINMGRSNLKITVYGAMSEKWCITSAFLSDDIHQALHLTMFFRVFFEVFQLMVRSLKEIIHKLIIQTLVFTYAA